MRVLVAFLLSVLGCRLAEGRNLTKCELRDEFYNLPDGMKPRSLTSDLVAKIICHVDLMSGFDTATIQQNPESGGSGDEGQTLYGLFQLSNLLACSDGTTDGTTDGPTDGTTDGPTEGPADGTTDGTTDGTAKLPNLCSADCDNFVDDDISDDIECVLKICNDLIEHGFRMPHYNVLKQWITLIFQPECSNTTSTEYFKECKPNPMNVVP